MTDTVIRWCDGYRTDPPLDVQLRARPNVCAVVAENLRGGEVADELRRIRHSLGDLFAVRALPTDDGEYGVIYEITARYGEDD